MQRFKRVFQWGLAILLIGTLILVGSQLRRGQTQTTGYTQVVTVERGTLVATIKPTGEVTARYQAKLSFDANGVTLIELNVAPGQQVQKGQVLARIDPSSLQRAVDQAEADLLSAEEALEKAKNPYTELDRKKAELDVALAEAALLEAKQATVEETLRQAEFNLESARLNLLITQHSTTVGKNVRDLEYTVRWHERKLRDLEALRQQGKVDQTAVDEEAEALAKARTQLEAARANANAALSAAEDKVKQAEETLAQLKAGLAEAQVRNKIAQAEYNLAKAKDTLATILAGPDPKAVQLAQARYNAAKAALEKAQATLDAATMTAPFDGTVISVGAEAGDIVSSSTVIVTLADLSNLRVLASVDETDISKVEVGQEATITFDAFPGRKFRGKVLEVPLEGKLVQNVVTYEVPISLEGTEGVPLKPGMTANVSIIVGRRENALLLPVLALQQGEDGYVVMVQEADGTTTATRVEVGLSDGTYVEIVRGLNEGDRVVIEYQTSTQQTSTFRGFGQMIPGGLLRR
ncbi:MAG: efflux RND transporter periplasmic adaptor subunit [Chloroflexi bacterium]|nr:efflux RND transporter periplasmic adaptor subunit [Chloroflexota bacterium]